MFQSRSENEPQQEAKTIRMQAVWNGAILAESDQTRVVEGNHYFPPDAIHKGYFVENAHHTVCPWKGTASYYDVRVGGKVNTSAAWFYPDTSPAAEHIRGYVAFWHGIRVQPAPDEA